MSTTNSAPESGDDDPWERLAEHRDTLEMCIEEDVAFAGRAEQLLERLDDEGYA